jgi:hypothetical protein
MLYTPDDLFLTMVDPECGDSAGTEFRPTLPSLTILS